MLFFFIHIFLVSFFLVVKSLNNNDIYKLLEIKDHNKADRSRWTGVNNLVLSVCLFLASTVVLKAEGCGFDSGHAAVLTASWSLL